MTNSPNLTLSDERKAERTLLKLTLDMTSSERAKFLQQFNISSAEYKDLKNKYSVLISNYRKFQDDSTDK